MMETYAYLHQSLDYESLDYEPLDDELATELNTQRQRGGTLKRLALSAIALTTSLVTWGFAGPAWSLQLGDEGAAVGDLQSRLASLNYYQYEVTGIYGEITAEAVSQFQADNNLLVDGIAGRETLAVLREREGSTPVATAPTNPVAVNPVVVRVNEPVINVRRVEPVTPVRVITQPDVVISTQPATTQPPTTARDTVDSTTRETLVTSAFNIVSCGRASCDF
ncbi:MAG: peptidoglycan-binding protein [Oculatellaceae cyanobacterium Prado106]|jgi:peptidoglycan hydrolase-like protein with peptidoglycan-binding domain|nr:peptidoglycan-binding protein [Oculatellaceae cyanobacterium Prado106]